MSPLELIHAIAIACYYLLFAHYYVVLPIPFATAFTVPSTLETTSGIRLNNRRGVLVIQSASELPTVATTELVSDNDDDDDGNDDDEWMSDMERAKRRRASSWKPATADPSTNTPPRTAAQSISSTVPTEDGTTETLLPNNNQKRLVYTADEVELIQTLGGKDLHNPSSKREPGFLGYCTLKEIAFDYQIPICYLADVLCGWGVPAPIDPDVILGDMVTGEQAFAVLEAIHTLDVGALNDRYAGYDLMTLCGEYGVDVIDGFELAVREGWNLPFGVRTFLRVEQEDKLIRILAKDSY